MRNLKRTLSLVLAAAMLIGMMVVSASAASYEDFTDADEIQYTEAVQTLVALNVINGKDDGSYDPSGSLTRAEMAKLITYVMNGGTEPVLGTKVNPTYSDIDDHWAEAYIEYCTSMGIIAGDGAGKFNPEGTLTGSQASKMILAAMGYNAEVFGFVGNDWEINTSRYANEAGLYDGLVGMVASNTITRDQVAQVFYNAIQAPLMQRSWSQNQTTGQVTETYNLAVGTSGQILHSLLKDKFGAQIFIGTFQGNSSTGAATTEGEIAVFGKLDTAESDAKDVKATFPSDLDISNIGEQVKVIFKDGTSGKTGQPDKNDTIYGVFNTGATTIVTGTRADVKDQKSTDAKIDIGGTKYDTKDEVTVITNYVGSGTSYDADNGTSTANSSLTTALKASNGDTIKAVTDPEDGKIQTIYITASKIAAVTGLNDEKVTMNNGVGTITIADNEVYDGIAKGDVVVVTTLYNSSASNEDAYSIVEKAEVVSGSVESFKEKENVKLDGTTYNIYNKTDMLGTIPDQTVTTSFADDDIGEDFDLYLVNGYVGAAVQVSESANNYSLVLANNGGTAGGAFNALELQVMAADGTKTVISVSDDSVDTNKDKTVDSKDFKVGDIIVYTGSDDDAVVTVKASVESGTKSYNENTKAFDGAVTSADAVLFAETSAAKYGATSGTTFKAYSIRSLNSFSSDDGSYAHVTDSNGKVVAVFADMKATPAGATSNTVYGIVSSYVGRVKIDDTNYYQYTVASNDESYTLNLASSAVIAKGDLVAFEPTSDDTYGSSDVDVISSGAVYVKEYSESDSTLTYFESKTGSDGNWTGANQKTLALDDDCAIIYVDADGDKAGSEIGVNAFDSVTGYKNAAIVTKADGTDTVIVAIFVETSNECDILSTESANLSKPDSAALTEALANNDVVTVSDFDATTKIEVTVPANKTLVVKDSAPAENSVVTVKEGATVQFVSDETTETFGKGGNVSVDADATIMVTGTGMKFECNGTVTFNVDYKFHKDNQFVSNGKLVASKAGITLIGNNVCNGSAFGADANFYTSAGEEGTPAVKEAFAPGVTYTWGTIYTDNGTAEGWVRNA